MAMHTNNVQLTLNVSFHVWKAPISSIIDRLFDAYCIGLSVFCIQGCKRRTMQGIIRSLWKEHIHKWPTITHLQWDVVSLYKYWCLGSDVYFALLFWLIPRMMFLCTLSYKKKKAMYVSRSVLKWSCRQSTHNSPWINLQIIIWISPWNVALSCLKGRKQIESIVYLSCICYQLNENSPFIFLW